MNSFNRNVIEKLGLSASELMQTQVNDNFFQQNSILSLYKLRSYNEKDEKQVLIKLNDIIGIGYDTDSSLYEVMDTLFDSNGDEYHSRSTALFNLTIDNFREKLFPELLNGKNRDPFKVSEKRKWKIRD